MSAVRVVAVISPTSLDQIAARVCTELLHSKSKGSFSVVYDPLFGPALMTTLGKRVNLIIVRPSIASLEKAHRGKIDVVMYESTLLLTDNALAALVNSIPKPEGYSNSHHYGAVWPKQKDVVTGKRILDVLV